MSLRVALSLTVAWTIVVAIFTTTFIAQDTKISQDNQITLPLFTKAEKSKEILYEYLRSASSSTSSSQDMSASKTTTLIQGAASPQQSSGATKNNTQNIARKDSSLLKNLLIIDETKKVDTQKEVTKPTTLAKHTLTVTPNQLGVVISISPGINCGTLCAISLEEGSTISLIAYPGQGVTFSGWGGACAGIGICTLQIKKDTLLSSNFEKEKITTPTPPAQESSTQGSSLFTLSQVSSHSSASDCWIIVNNNVYSVGSYISLHPGGRSAITGQCGKDATNVFTTRGGTGSHSTNAHSILGTFLIGTYTTLSPTTGVCGGASTATFLSQPTEQLCNTGSPSSVTGSGPWAWSCTGTNGGGSASCSATLQSSSQFSLSQIGAHITSSDCWIIVNNNVYSVGSYISLHPGGRSAITGQCGKDATTAFTTRGGTGSHSTNAHSILNTFLIGTVAQAPSPINGVCGQTNGTSQSSAPSTNLCASGSIASFTGSGPWTWSCTGTNGGSSASCSAQLLQGNPTPVNGVCGSSNGASVSNAPSTNLCSTGSASSVTGSGPWAWNCTGTNGGGSASCSATQSQSQGAPQNYTVNVTSAGIYDTTSLTLHPGDSITFVYAPPRGDEVKTTFSPSGISSITIDKDITQKKRTFNTTGTWTFKATGKNGNTGTVVVQ